MPSILVDGSSGMAPIEATEGGRARCPRRIQVMRLGQRAVTPLDLSLSGPFGSVIVFSRGHVGFGSTKKRKTDATR
eukprot:scaffold300900_cov26-Tisochrysis_lutea.AAC.2